MLRGSFTSVRASLASVDRNQTVQNTVSGLCPEFKSIGTNGPLGLKKVGHFRKYGALVNFPYMIPMIYQHLFRHC